MPQPRYAVWPNVPREIQRQMSFNCHNSVADLQNMVAGYFVYHIQETAHLNAAREQTFFKLSEGGYMNNFFSAYMKFALDYAALLRAATPQATADAICDAVGKYTALFACCDTAVENNNYIYHNMLDNAAKQGIQQALGTYKSVNEQVEMMRRQLGQQAGLVNVNTSVAQPLYSTGGVGAALPQNGGFPQRNLPGSGNNLSTSNDNGMTATGIVDLVPNHTVAEVGVVAQAQPAARVPQPVHQVENHLPDVAKVDTELVKQLRVTLPISKTPVFCFGDSELFLRRDSKSGQYRYQVALRGTCNVDPNKHQNKHLLAPVYEGFQTDGILELSNQDTLLAEVQELLTNVKGSADTAVMEGDFSFPLKRIVAPVESCGQPEYVTNDIVQQLFEPNSITWDRETTGLVVNTYNFDMDLLLDTPDTRAIFDEIHKAKSWDIIAHQLECLVPHTKPEYWSKLNDRATSIINRFLKLYNTSYDSIANFVEDITELSAAFRSETEEAFSLLHTTVLNQVKHEVFPIDLSNVYTQFDAEAPAGFYLADVRTHLFVPRYAKDIKIMGVDEYSAISIQATPLLYELVRSILETMPKHSKNIIMHTIDNRVCYIYLGYDRGAYTITATNL